MLILSIDVGIKNLAMCLLDDQSNLVKNWDVSGVPPQHADGLFPSLNKHMNEKPWTLTADVTLIEKQPDKNRKMKTVENFLHSYFVIKNPDKETIIYDARHKIPDVAGPGKEMYRKRKQASIDRCREFLENSETNAHWRETFKNSKKKDDLADTVMQALSFTKRIVPKSESKKEKKLIGRRPNENQKETKYSVCNLVWLMKNEKREKLEKDKRFMKDLKRYYSSFDELFLSIIK